MDSRKPTFNLKAVVQQTGLKPDTLRAWERRYGLPDPERTAGGHRLYSERDIEILKWLLARQDEGLSISRAIKLWRSLLAEGEDPFQAMPIESPTAELVELPSNGLGDNIASMRQEWIEACMEFDERHAESVLTQAFAYYPPEIVCFELLQKAIVEIGNRWYQGKATVQQEHFASALALRRLDALLAATPAPTKSRRVVVACAPEDDHTFSPLLLTLILRRQGWDVVYLGAKVPATRIEATVVKTQPDLVIFSAQLLHTAANLLEVAHLLQSADVTMAYGGLVFNMLPDIRQRFPAHYLGERLEKAPIVIESLINSPHPVPEVKPLTEEYQHAYSYFRERAALIEAEVWQMLSDSDVSQRELSQANAHMTRNMTAALSLGNLDFIGTDMRWVEGLMVNYGIPLEQLRDFTQVYLQAAHKHLNAPAGAIILEWLDRVLDPQQTSDLGVVE